MAGLSTLSTGATRTDDRPFDVILSLALDEVIVALDARPVGLRRLFLRLRKRILERHIPAWYPMGGR